MDSLPCPISNRSVESRANSKWVISCRYLMAFMGCIGFTIAYAIRTNLSVAIVAMVNSTDSKSTLHDSQTTSHKSKEFTWSEETQGVILSSFYYGYIVTQIPGGWIASRFGGKHLFGLGIFLSAILTLLTPWAAWQSVGALVAVRVLEGVGQGVTFPAMNALLSSWSPPDEKSMMITIALASGCSLGPVIAQTSSGVLCASSFLGGWPSVFYIFGFLGVVWYLLWLFLVYEKPAIHPRISEHEKHYIISSIGCSQDDLLKKHKVPWMEMFKSLPVFAINMYDFAIGWVFYTFITGLPSFYKDVLGLKIEEDGFVSSIPFIASLVYSFIVAWFADWLIRRRICSVGEVRKLATIGGLVIPACLLISASYVGKEDKILSIVLVSLSITFQAMVNAGAGVNQLDIAPRFAGILMGVANTFATLSGIVSPLVTGWLTNNEPTRGQWQKVFYISAIICVVGAVIFVVFGSGEVQPWNDGDLLEEVEVERESRKPDSRAQHHESINPTANQFINNA